MVSDMPEWFRNYLENNTGFDLKLGRITSQSEAVRDFYDFIIKPENAAKLSCVETLIEAAKPCFSDLQKVLSCTDDEICKACKLEEALAPFKGGD